MKTLTLFVLCSIAIISSGFSQSYTIDTFSGDWSGKGLLMGKEASFSMQWKKVLDEKFYQLTFKNQFKDGSFSMMAHGYYKFNPDSSLSGYWFDSRGVSFPLSGSYSSNTLNVSWGSKETEQGKTEYIYQLGGKMKVIDYVLRNGTYQKFAEAAYIKN